ncbi:hypothetical protein LguiA_035091 [Lonicera macranthoides]
MGFCRGDQIEVVGSEEGFVGSYYSAVVITQLLKKEYIVQYKTLLKDDLTGPLREIVAADEVRPVPPEIPVTVFGMYDKVDAFDNDGWWVGKITGKIEGMYYVYFETTKDEVKYPLSRLRVHQDWVDGTWVSSYNNRLRLTLFLDAVCVMRPFKGGFREFLGTYINIVYFGMRLYRCQTPGLARRLEESTRFCQIGKWACCKNGEGNSPLEVEAATK